MTRLPLTTYLRTYRRRSGLSQEEVAFLLGTASGTTVSRHEGGNRQPVLETGLAYEIIFGTSVRELYLGLYRKMEKRVQPRARRLLDTLLAQTAAPKRDRKIILLKQVLDGVRQKT